MPEEPTKILGNLGLSPSAASRLGQLIDHVEDELILERFDAETHPSPRAHQMKAGTEAQ